MRTSAYIKINDILNTLLVNLLETQNNYYLSCNYIDLYFQRKASIYPDGDVPIVLTSAKITAEAMLEDIKI